MVLRRVWFVTAVIRLPTLAVTCTSFSRLHRKMPIRNDPPSLKQVVFHELKSCLDESTNFDQISKSLQYLREFPYLIYIFSDLAIFTITNISPPFYKFSKLSA